jgi:hypothetical protein
MRISGLGLMSSVTIMFVAGAVHSAQAAKAITLQAGGASGPNANLVFNKNSKPPEIVVRTKLLGVAGSRIEVTVDRAKKAVFSHIFSAEERKFVADGSMCEVLIPATDVAYGAILAQFRGGRAARITVLDAGVMKMDQVVSLRGFPRALRRTRM